MWAAMIAWPFFLDRKIPFEALDGVIYGVTVLAWLANVPGILGPRPSAGLKRWVLNPLKGWLYIPQVTVHAAYNLVSRLTRRPWAPKRVSVFRAA